jgi:hypothetical protein
MANGLAIYAFALLTPVLEVALLVILWRGGSVRRLGGLAAYISVLLGTEVARDAVLYHYGLRSLAYAYFYWLSDLALVLGAFLLVCAFFRRACSGQTPLWQHMRQLLGLVFVLVVGVSLISLSRNYASLVTIFVAEFEQNLYFTSLVLVTLLYILMQYFKPADDELGLLVCGLGIQFAGPAANFALVHLTSGEFHSTLLLRFILPLCTLGMLAVWTYAVTGVRKAARESRAPIREQARLTESEA